MTEANFKFETKWFKGSRDRGYRGKIHSEKAIPELLRLKTIQDIWDSEETNTNMAA